MKINKLTLLGLLTSANLGSAQSFATIDYGLAGNYTIYNSDSTWTATDPWGNSMDGGINFGAVGGGVAYNTQGEVFWQPFDFVDPIVNYQNLTNWDFTGMNLPAGQTAVAFENFSVPVTQAHEIVVLGIDLDVDDLIIVPTLGGVPVDTSGWQINQSLDIYDSANPAIPDAKEEPYDPVSNPDPANSSLTSSLANVVNSGSSIQATGTYAGTDWDQPGIVIEPNTAYDRLEFRSATGDRTGFSFAYSLSAPVPEPTGVAYGVIAACGLMLRRKRS